MNRSPRVTVYLTNHNYGRYLAQAIDSVLAQTMQDFELIVIDDGSTDDSREVIERYASNPRIVTVFQENKGLNVTNNIALRAARGDYVIRLDADDWLDPHALQVMSAMLDRDADVGLVFPGLLHGRCRWPGDRDRPPPRLCRRRIARSAGARRLHHGAARGVARDRRL